MTSPRKPRSSNPEPLPVKGRVSGPSAEPEGPTGAPGDVDVVELAGSPALVTGDGRVVVVCRTAGWTVVEVVDEDDVDDVEDEVDVLVVVSVDDVVASVELALTMLVLVVEV